MNDPEVVQYLVVRPPITREAEEAWYDSVVKDLNTVFFAIHAITPEKKLIGNCSVGMRWKDRVGSLGIAIGEKEFWGKGFGTEAMRLLVDYSFETLNLQKVELEVHGFNERAFKCYEKVGFKEEARRREAKFINGEYTDSVLMGLLREDWIPLEQISELNKESEV